MRVKFLPLFILVSILMGLPESVFAQGVTTASLNGIVQDADGNPLPGANVIAEHIPTGSQYGAATRDNGFFNLPNLRVGGPYTVTVSYIGYNPQKKENINLNLGQDFRIEFTLESEAVTVGEVVVAAEQDAVLNSNRTGAATYIVVDQIQTLPTIKRSIRDLIRLDPRSDGNYSFGGKNWLYNNISLDGSYFNNSFGLDDPAPGGQTNAEPVPYDAVEQVQVSVAPFDVREGGFTGAGINTVTKSGTNQFKGSIYSFIRNESFVGNKVSGQDVIANPDLIFYQSGFSVGGPVIQNELFFFLNAELERREDPGSNFAARRGTSSGLGISRVDAAVMDAIRTRMKEVYGYDTGPYENYTHFTQNEKMLLILDWNINENNNLIFRYNRFRDNRDPFSEPFPTIEIVENGITYTTIGEEPFSAHNILDQDVWQATNNFSYFLDKHVLTVGATFEYFSFFNSFNIFRNGVFFLPDFLDFIGGARFSSLADFYSRTHPALPDTDRINFRGMIGSGPDKGENIEVGQLAFYAQDEFLVSPAFYLNIGLRVDLPFYITEPGDNPFSRGLTLLEENDK